MTTKEKTIERAYNSTHFIQDVEAFVQVGGFITSLSQGWGCNVILEYLGSDVDFAKSLNIKVNASHAGRVLTRAQGREVVPNSVL